MCCEVRVMELRRRRGDAVNDARGSNVEASIAGTISDDSFAGVSPTKRPTKGKTEDSVHDGGFTPSSSEAADAVVGAAVRGGSLLMVLALVQVWCSWPGGSTSEAVLTYVPVLPRTYCSCCRSVPLRTGIPVPGTAVAVV